MDRTPRVPFGGRAIDPKLHERTADAAWFAESVYAREVALGATEERARDATLNRLRAIHDAEMHAARAALDLRDRMVA